MPLPPRIYYTNLVKAVGTILVPSSEQPGLTREALLRTGVHDSLRFKVGWDVKMGVNDRIDFQEGLGPDTYATIAASNYATAALYAAAVVAALEAADATPVWAVSQDTTTGFWTISTAAHPFTLHGSTGPNKARSALADLGFDAVDTGEALTHTGSVATYQSRKWIALDTGADLRYWLIEEGVNDAIDFSISSTPYVGYVEPGEYENGQALAAAALVALEEAFPGGGWGAGYDDVTGFYLSRSNPWVLLTNTGAHLATAIWADLGYATTADHDGPVALADYFVQGSPLPLAELAAILGHSVSYHGVVRVDAHASSLIAVGLDATVDFTQVLERDPEGRSDLRLAEFPAVRPERYWRLVIDDRISGAMVEAERVQPFIEVGIWLLGTSLELSSVAPGVVDERSELTVLIYAAEGAHSRVERETRRIWNLTIQNITDADKVALEAFAGEVKVGGAFFFILEPEDLYSARYVFFEQGLAFEQQEDADPRLWTASARLLEVIG